MNYCIVIDSSRENGEKGWEQIGFLFTSSFQICNPPPTTVLQILRELSVIKTIKTSTVYILRFILWIWLNCNAAWASISCWLLFNNCRLICNFSCFPHGSYIDIWNNLCFPELRFQSRNIIFRWLTIVRSSLGCVWQNWPRWSARWVWVWWTAGLKLDTPLHSAHHPLHCSSL